MNKQKSVIASCVGLVCLVANSPVYAAENKSDDVCPVVPPVIVYVDKPVPGPTVLVTPAPVIVTRNVPMPAPTVTLPAKPAEKIVRTITRTKYLFDNKPETVIALAQAQEQILLLKAAYSKMRQKYLALAKSKKRKS